MTIPRPPAHLLQRIANDDRFDAFAGSLPPLRVEVKQLLAAAGLPWDAFGDVLDFGCGVGRLLFAFRDHLAAHQKLYACDVSEECAQWCAANIDFATIAHNGVFPPLPYAAGSFDLVTAISVFTHLRLDLQFRWAAEVYRVLRPGGAFFVTLHGPFYFPVFVKTLRDQPVERAAEAGGNPAEGALADDAAGGESPPQPPPSANGRAVGLVQSLGEDGLFSYMNLHGTHDDIGQIDVAAAQTPTVSREVFSMFALAARVPQSRLAGGQDVYILRKPTDARPLAMPEPGAAAAAGVAADGWNTFVETAGGEGIEVPLSLAGQRTLRAYPSVSPEGFYHVEANVEVTDERGASIARARVPLNNIRAYGKTHQAIVRVELPAHEGPVTVRLRSEVTERGTLPEGFSPTVTWSYLNAV